MTSEDAILELLSAAAAPVAVVFNYETEPALPYITLALKPGKTELVELGPVTEDGMQTVHGSRDLAVELQAYGSAAYVLLDEIGLRLMLPRFQDHAESLGLAVFERGQLMGLPPIHEGGAAERRGSLELGVRYVKTVADYTGVIETVNGSNTITGGQSAALESDFSVTVETQP